MSDDEYGGGGGGDFDYEGPGSDTSLIPHMLLSNHTDRSKKII